MSNTMATQQYLQLQQQQQALAEQQRAAEEEKNKKEGEELTANILTACTASHKASETVLVQGINKLTESSTVLQHNRIVLAGQDNTASSSADSSNGGGLKRVVDNAVRGSPRGKAKPIAKPSPPVQNVDARLTPFQNRHIAGNEQEPLADFLEVTGIPWGEMQDDKVSSLAAELD